MHAGECGPIIPFALHAGKRPSGQRANWDDRHQVQWKNDVQHLNMRSYFDRPVDRADMPQVPRRAFRPHWSLDVPKNAAAAKEVYKVFDAAQARFVEQWQWMPMKLEEAGIALESLVASTAPSATAKSSGSKSKTSRPLPPKPRTPRQPEDLRTQRGLEKSWDKHYSNTYSRWNHKVPINFRSYFDRWKDDELQNGGMNNNELPWRLTHGVKEIGKLGKSASAPDPFKDRGGLPGQKAWVGNFDTNRPNC